MRIFLLFILIILLSNCTTVEFAKEITKATKSIKTSSNNIIESLENNNQEKIIEETTDDQQIINADKFANAFIPTN